MFRTIKIALFAIALCGVATVAMADVSYGDPASWNILDQNFGSGSGQIAFNSAFDAGFGTPAATETLYDGKSNLVVPSSGTCYPVKTNFPGLPTDNSDITIEVKLATLGNARALLGFADKPSGPTYNHFFLVNGVTYPDGGGRSAMQQSDTLADYSAPIGSTMTPSGFDGSAVHTYRFVRHDFGAGTSTTLYLDNNPTALGTLVSSSGPGGGDAQTWEWGLFGSGSSYDVYYAKVATGAFLPQPTPEPSSMVLLAVGVVSLLAYAWRKRK
jgi:hypothetical protein